MKLQKTKWTVMVKRKWFHFWKPKFIPVKIDTRFWVGVPDLTILNAGAKFEIGYISLKEWEQEYTAWLKRCAQ